MPSFLLYLRTFVIGTLGGLIGHLLNLPLGWLLGAMAATVPFAIAGVSVPASWRLRSVMIAVIGVMVGGAFTPDVVSRAGEWAFSLVGVALYGVMVSLVGVWFCRRFGRHDRPTAAFAAAPGGLSEILVLGPGLGADVRTLSLVHGMRLVIILATVPAVVTAIGINGAMPARSIDLSIAMPPADAAILVGCVVLGMVLGRLLRLPAGNLTGPLILSAGAHFAEWTLFHPPQIAVVAAQIVIGMSVAKFFAGISWRQLVGDLTVGGGLTAFTLTLAALFALGFERLLGIPFTTAFLALVPGGLPEMSLVAISLGIDPAFVSLHHLFRVILVLTLAPVLIPLWLRRAESSAAD